MRVPLRHLVIVLGDQLDLDAAAFDDFDAARDRVWMAEVVEEATHVWSSKARIAMFLAAMRHFAEALRARGRPLSYRRIDDDDDATTLGDALRRTLGVQRPQRLVMTAPGDWRVLQMLRGVAADAGIALEIRNDRHFHATVRDFAAFARGRRSLRMEDWYRHMRRRSGILMVGDEPLGGRWNFDADNRSAFPKTGPPRLPPRRGFAPDTITTEVLATVECAFADHPGSLAPFDWPVTRTQALDALEAFVEERLPQFGRYQDAMWSDAPWLFHAHLSAALNLKLLNPREVVEAAVNAHRSGHAPLAAVEGFVRQILGWREYVRGVYWTQMPSYLARNALGADRPLPAFYWSGDTDMHCLRQAIGQTLATGYAHHIQRLMITGLYTLLLGVEPRQVHAWYLSVYVDAVEWVELPNTLGMSQYADGGLLGSKPYVASGRYIQRMSNYCAGCRYDPGAAVGETACPFTTLYWDFLDRHRARLAGNRRMTMQLRNLERLTAERLRAIRGQAARLRGSG